MNAIFRGRQYVLSDIVRRLGASFTTLHYDCMDRWRHVVTVMRVSQLESVVESVQFVS